MVNVKDFGAVADGVHDDTDAVLQAIEAARAGPDHEVFFPPGRYRTRGVFNGLRPHEPRHPNEDEPNRSK